MTRSELYCGILVAGMPTAAVVCSLILQRREVRKFRTAMQAFSEQIRAESELFREQLQNNSMLFRQQIKADALLFRNQVAPPSSRQGS